MRASTVVTLLAAGALALSTSAAQAQAVAPGDRDLVLDVCTRCHGLDYYVTPRSRKSWELTVYNMQSYYGDEEESFSEQEAEIVIDYLTEFFDEDSELDPMEHFSETPPDTYAAAVAEPAVAEAAPAVPETVQEPAREPTPVAAAAAPPVAKPLPDRVRRRLESPPWRPGRTLLLCAEHSGYVAVLALLTLLVTGHSRRKLRRRFRPVHIAAALVLFLSLASHGLVYLARYGNPPVLWYWFGVLSFLVLVLAQVQGIVRKRFGRTFLRIHMAAGYAGLTLAVLHWVWAWL